MRNEIYHFLSPQILKRRMDMDWKGVFILVQQRYIVPTIVVLILLASGMGYVLLEYKQLQEEKGSLVTERNSFYEDRILFERNRADALEKLQTRESELSQREFVLKQLEDQYKNRLGTLQSRAVEYDIAARKLQEAEASISQGHLLKEAEGQLQKLMSEFSDMGVDLNKAPRCEDDALAKYNSAKSKFSEAVALAEAKGLYERYKQFFNENRQWFQSGCLRSETGSASQ